MNEGGIDATAFVLLSNCVSLASCVSYSGKGSTGRRLQGRGHCGCTRHERAVTGLARLERRMAKYYPRREG
ncbi:uncharacterized protein BO66DRAFT_41111 [Aspergillus aculeatinus CBS 121060]|uniref:Uncharacterized protein n=1 Tax=Aspergillus aculeatinus CBS 121060 TaxID=1448322 RepID=A0ACD1HEL6_9EURO|nr:hypothetical protein BO66DRAFT_41111 [Aspergillus aculeatinus CBS 121060]RAH72231.1 hypothetical protein BO66DRAFT_41111 [Aspergillus aculeatinus CBS 121060]